MIERLRELNPSLELFDVTDEKFLEYGRPLYDLDASEITEEAKKISRVKEGSLYSASVPTFESLTVAKEIKDKIFGTLPCEIGYCHGHNNILGATEWHSSSELNIAITPLVLILGKRSDIRNGRLNSADMKAFYLPQGTVVEVYATTLHFCPCEVTEEGFGCVVGLPEGTNLPLDYETDDKTLFRKNKWLIAHEENEGLIAKGAVAGIFGENYKINY
ncbi:MAG: DUF4867 family protein [Clostridia bacterium]|nr:DUF4867 family protein [Clostridia bacterium]